MASRRMLIDFAEFIFRRIHNRRDEGFSGIAPLQAMFLQAVASEYHHFGKPPLKLSPQKQREHMKILTAAFDAWHAFPQWVRERLLDNEPLLPSKCGRELILDWKDDQHGGAIGINSGLNESSESPVLLCIRPEATRADVLQALRRFGLWASTRWNVLQSDRNDGKRFSDIDRPFDRRPSPAFAMKTKRGRPVTSLVAPEKKSRRLVFFPYEAYRDLCAIADDEGTEANALACSILVDWIEQKKGRPASPRASQLGSTEGREASGPAAA